MSRQPFCDAPRWAARRVWIKHPGGVGDSETGFDSPNMHGPGISFHAPWAGPTHEFPVPEFPSRSSCALVRLFSGNHSELARDSYQQRTGSHKRRWHIARCGSIPIPIRQTKSRIVDQIAKNAFVHVQITAMPGQEPPTAVDLDIARIITAGS